MNQLCLLLIILLNIAITIITTTTTTTTTTTVASFATATIENKYVCYIKYIITEIKTIPRGHHRIDLLKFDQEVRTITNTRRLYY